MNLRDCYIEEDLFPRIFTDYEEREYGILFFNTDNKDSYDSNHAVIYKDSLTYAEIEKIAGLPIDHSFLTYTVHLSF